MGDFTQNKMAGLPNRRPSCQPLCCIYSKKQSTQLSGTTEVYGGLKMDTLTGVLIILLLFVLRFAVPFAVTMLIGRFTERFTPKSA